jgi:type II secretory pathway component GspD/PulD (secretin)
MLDAMRQGGGLREDDTFEFTAFAEPVDLANLIEFVREELGLQLLYTDSGLSNQTVVINTPITLRKDQVLTFLLTLMEQKDYTIIQDDSGVHMVMPKGSIQPSMASRGALAPTKVIRTPGIKPSAMTGLVQGLIGTRGGAAAGGASIQYLDELGVIVVTDTPRNTRMVEEAVQTVLAERIEQKFQRFEIQNIAASSARDRIIELLGSTAPRAAGAQPGQQPQANVAAAVGGSFSNLPERLSVDPGGNALFFRGREDEARLMGEMLAIVDVPITLVSRFYPVGIETAETVATEGSRQQLGDVTTFESSASGTGSVGLGRAQPAGRVGQANQPGGLQQGGLSGSGFVIYPAAGGFIYRGTEAQHARVDLLVRELGDLIDRDAITTEFYKLKYAKAEEVAETINSLISGTAPTGGAGSPLLGRDLGSRDAQGRQRRVTRPEPQAADSAAATSATGEATLGELEGTDVFVLADEKNNQVLIKAPKRLQPQMKTLISRLDLLRPQVYIEAKIVTVTIGDDFRFAAEVQTIIGQFALNTNFGLGSFADGGGLTSPKDPATNLAGLTSALIRSKDVPFIINTIARNNNARVVASPQLLVDDNEEAEVSSLDQQPTLTTSIGSNGGNDTQSFGGFEPAGPKLRVIPQISDGGSIKLEYEIELSAFSGESTVPGVPPPKREDKVRADSVTVPSDTTIVVGGLVFDSTTETRSGIPLLMDIPWIGYMFSDTRKNTRKTLLYVFMTPKVMRDTSFNDLRLLTKATMDASALDPEIPVAEPLRMELLDQNVRRPVQPDEGSLRRPPPPRPNEWPMD